MASAARLFAHPPPPAVASFPCQRPARHDLGGFLSFERRAPPKRTVAVSGVGEVSAGGTAYLIAGSAAVALLSTAFPILFFRKDPCPECEGAGFRQSGVALRANAERKDQSQIVCPRCNG